MNARRIRRHRLPPVPLPPDKARRMRMFATGLLVLMAGVFLTARHFQVRNSAFTAAG